jgi:hypothetical protein
MTILTSMFNNKYLVSDLLGEKDGAYLGHLIGLTKVIICRRQVTRFSTWPTS